MNRRVFSKIGLIVPDNVIKGLVDMKSGVIDVVLANLKIKLLNYLTHIERGVVAAPGAGPGEVYRQPIKQPGHRASVVKYGTIPAVAPSTHHKSPNASMTTIHAVASNGDHDAALVQMLQVLRSSRSLQKLILFFIGTQAKERTILDFQESVSMLRAKLQKLEQLAALKDHKIDEMAARLRAVGAL